MNTFFPTWPVDGPPPIPPVHGLLPAAAAPAAGVRFVVDTTDGPADENGIAPNSAGLEPGLYRQADGSIWMRAQDGSTSQVWVPAMAGRERWISGVAVWPYPQETPESWDACSSGSQRGTKSFGDPVTPPEFNALTLSVPITCTSQQVTDQAAFRARAVAVLAATESYGVARELMGGFEFPGQPYFADGQGTFPNGDVATRSNHALQILEEAIAGTGRLGLIHCTPMMAVSLQGQGFALSDKTGVIRTIVGNVVIPDAGYVGCPAPAGHADAGTTQEWAYATGPVDVRRSDLFTTPDTLAQALDRGMAATTGRTNQITYRAERYYVTDWDTALHAAVLVDRCSIDCNVGS